MDAGGNGSMIRPERAAAVALILALAALCAVLLYSPRASATGADAPIHARADFGSARVHVHTGSAAAVRAGNACSHIHAGGPADSDADA